MLKKLFLSGNPENPVDESLKTIENTGFSGFLRGQIKKFKKIEKRG